MPQTPKRRPRGACRGKSGSICSFLKLVVGLHLLYTQPNRRHPGTACVLASASGGAPACKMRGASEEESSSGGWRPLQGLAMEDATFRSLSRAGMWLKRILTISASTQHSAGAHKYPKARRGRQALGPCVQTKEQENRFLYTASGLQLA